MVLYDPHLVLFRPSPWVWNEPSNFFLMSRIWNKTNKKNDELSLLRLGFKKLSFPSCSPSVGVFLGVCRQDILRFWAPHEFLMGMSIVSECPHHGERHDLQRPRVEPMEHAQIHSGMHAGPRSETPLT